MNYSLFDVSMTCLPIEIELLDSEFQTFFRINFNNSFEMLFGNRGWIGFLRTKRKS